MRNFDHAHSIISRAAPHGMYVRTYGYDMGWRGAIECIIVTTYMTYMHRLTYVHDAAGRF